MTYAARSADFHRHVAFGGQPTDSKTAARPSLLTRLFNVMFENRERGAARDVEAYLARTGHRFTDSIEREINERHFNGGWDLRR